MYKVILAFPERYDDNHQYAPGDAYPREGFAPPDGRAEALASDVSGPLNRTGKVYLEPDDDARKAAEAEAKKQEAEAKKKAAAEKKAAEAEAKE